MSKIYITNCRRCGTKTEHYVSSGSCKPCMKARVKAHRATPEGRAKNQEHCRNYMRRCYAARDLVKRLGLKV